MSPTIMWSRTRTPTYFKAWTILFVVSMSSLEGSHSYLEGHAGPGVTVQEACRTQPPSLERNRLTLSFTEETAPIRLSRFCWHFCGSRLLLVVSSKWSSRQWSGDRLVECGRASAAFWSKCLAIPSSSPNSVGQGDGCSSAEEAVP